MRRVAITGMGIVSSSLGNNAPRSRGKAWRDTKSGIISAEWRALPNMGFRSLKLHGQPTIEPI